MGQGEKEGRGEKLCVGDPEKEEEEKEEERRARLNRKAQNGTRGNYGLFVVGSLLRH